MVSKKDEQTHVSVFVQVDLKICEVRIGIIAIIGFSLILLMKTLQLYRTPSPTIGQLKENVDVQIGKIRLANSSA